MVFFTCGELALVLLRVFLSSGMVVEFRDKLRSIVPGNRNVCRVASMEFNVRYRMLYDNYANRKSVA